MRQALDASGGLAQLAALLDHIVEALRKLWMPVFDAAPELAADLAAASSHPGPSTGDHDRVTDAIHLLQPDGSVLEVQPAPYNAEADLQRLLEAHPSLIPGSWTGTDDTPRRWLLITKEAGVPREDGGSAWWSLDHLFVDQDAVPTFIEIKRSTDTRIRREVVAQMLEYAANGTAYWSTDQCRALFETRLRAAGGDPDQVLADFLQSEDGDPRETAETFWGQFGANLADGRVRLLFVADEIPPTLRRLVEFLNERTDHRLEILAVEIQQYVGADHSFRALVPRVIGATAQAEARKIVASGRRRTVWSEEDLLTTVQDRFPTALPVVASILGWARGQPYLRLQGGRGQNYPSRHVRADSLRPTARWREILSVYAGPDKPWLELHVKRLGRSITTQARERLLGSILAAGIDHPMLHDQPFSHRPNLDLTHVSEEQARSLCAVLDWWIDEIRSHPVADAEQDDAGDIRSEKRSRGSHVT